MHIKLTDKLAVNEETFASIVKAPFDATVANIKAKSRKKAAKKFAKSHRMVLTLQTLPDDIYKLIPKSECLQTIDGRGARMAIDMGIELPTIEGLIGSSYPQRTTKILAPIEDVIGCHPVAAKEWKDCEPIAERGRKFAELVKDYLNLSGFTTPTQICWSAPELVACVLHIRPSGGGRGRTGQQILLARLSDRRYVDRKKMRTPKVVRAMPDELLSYIGEAKLLSTAMRERD